MLKCNYAWGHLDFKKGHYAPCFRYNVGPPNSPPTNSELRPSEAINSSYMQEIRRSLASGVFPKGCADCKYKEENGLTSYRQESLTSTKFKTLNPDYSSTMINKIVELELKFNRKCNFLCRHCDSQSNDAFEVLGKKNPNILKELEELDFVHVSEPKFPIVDISEENIQDIIDNIVPTVDQLFFSGGEPLYHAAHYQFLLRLIAHPNIDTKKITLGYNTNMSIINFKNYDLFDIWENFQDIDITVSLDGTGELFNYFREKGEYNKVIENIYSVARQSKNLKSMLFVCTSSAYHAFYAEEIFTDISQLVENLSAEFQNIKFSIKPTFVHYPAPLDMVNLPDADKEVLVNRLTQSLEHKSINYQNAINAVLKKLTGTRTSTECHFKKMVKIQDTLYNKNSKQSCPRIYEYVYNDIIIK